MCGALGGRVAAYWTVDSVDEPRRERILPTGCAQLIVDLDAATAILVGPAFVSRDLDRHRSGRMLGVAFHAGGLCGLVGPAALELADHVVPLDEVWASCALADELSILDPTPAIQRIEHELLRRHLDCKPSGAVVAAANAVSAGIASSDVPALVGVGRRDLVPEFRRTVGVGLKRFANLQRFRRSLHALRSPMPSSLASIAADNGYADQAHLTREVQHFAGVTPSVLLGDCTPTPNHLSTDKIFKTPTRQSSMLKR